MTHNNPTSDDANPEEADVTDATPGGQTTKSAKQMTRRTFVAGVGASAAAATGATAQSTTNTTNTTNTTDGGGGTQPDIQLDYVGAVSAVGGVAAGPAFVAGIDAIGSSIDLSDVKEYAINPNDDATEVLLWQMMNSENEDLEQHLAAAENWIDRSRSLAQIEARNAIASTYEAGGSATEARSAAADAIDAYYTKLQKQNWKMAAKISASCVYVDDVANASSDVPDGFVGPARSGALGLKGKQTTLTAIDGSKNDVFAANHDDSKLFLTGLAPGETIGYSNFSSANVTENLNENYIIDTIVMNVPVENGEDLQNIQLRTSELAKIDAELRAEAQAAKANLSISFVEGLFSALNNGQITPKDIRGISGLANQIAGTEDPTVSAHQMAISAMTGAARPDLSESSSMTLKVTGYKTGDTPADSPPSVSDRLDGEQIQGFIFSDTAGAVSPGDTIERVGTLRHKLSGRGDDVAVDSKNAVAYSVTAGDPVQIEVMDLEAGSAQTVDAPPANSTTSSSSVSVIVDGSGSGVVGVDYGVVVVDPSGSTRVHSGPNGPYRPLAAADLSADIDTTVMAVDSAGDLKIYETGEWKPPAENPPPAAASSAAVSRGRNIGVIRSSSGPVVYADTSNDGSQYGFGALGGVPSEGSLDVSDRNHLTVGDTVTNPQIESDATPNADSLSQNPVTIYDAQNQETFSLAVGDVVVQEISAPDGSTVSGPVEFGDPNWTTTNVQEYIDKTQKAADKTADAVQKDPTFGDGPIVGGGGDGDGGSGGGGGLGSIGGLGTTELVGLLGGGGLVAYLLSDSDS